jgi:uncharacterized membrane protein
MPNDQDRHRPREQDRRGTRTPAPPRKTIEVLPSPEVLESYNYVVEGSAEKIIGMFEREQKHRHEWEARALRVHMISTLLGQVLGFLIAMAIFISACLIGIYGDKTLGATIWVFGMSIVVMSALVWAYAKTLGQRPLFGRPAMRTHFRPQKEKSEDAA